MKDNSPLPDGALVVRGGIATAEKLFDACVQHEQVFGFSVQSDVETTVLELSKAGGIPHGTIGVTTVGEIRSIGFDVFRTGGKGRHATVEVSEGASQADLEPLAALFEARPNPRRRT